MVPSEVGVKVAPLNDSFTSGELSPLAQARVMADRYKTGLAKCSNYLILKQGGLKRRPGTRYIAAAKATGDPHATRLIPFIAATDAAYVLEFGQFYARVFRNRAQVLAGGNPYEIVTTYTSAQLAKLKFTQSADTLYLVHPEHPPRTLTRTADDSWTLATFVTKDGPFLQERKDGIRLANGTIANPTITASASLFASTDVGRQIRLQHKIPPWKTGDPYAVGNVVLSDSGKVYQTTIAGTAGGTAPTGTGYTISDGAVTWRYIGVFDTWLSWGTITAIISPTQASITMTRLSPVIGYALSWWFGAWSGTTGYPACVAFFGDRLIFGGMTAYPNRVDGSRVGEYSDFALSDQDGLVTDAHAISFAVLSKQRNQVVWMSSHEQGLVIGTTGGEFLVAPGGQDGTLTPTSVIARQTTSFGSADVEPVRVGQATLFVDRSGKAVREARFFMDAGGTHAQDISLLSEHLLADGVEHLAFQAYPIPILWAITGDGDLRGSLYVHDAQNLQVGWFQNHIGGNAHSNTEGSAFSSAFSSAFK